MNNEVIVELLGEGGSRALYAVRSGERWLFAMDFIDQLEPPGAHTGSPIVASWPEALELLDAHAGWYRLAPKHVHPEFRRALLRAVVERTASETDTHTTERWRAACAHGPSDFHPPLITTGPVHSSDAWLYDEVDDLEPSDAEIESLRSSLRKVGTDEATIDRMAPRKRPGPG